MTTTMKQFHFRSMETLLVLQFLSSIVTTFVCYSSSTETTIASGNATLLSSNQTFALGFFSFSTNACYLGIWYATIPIRTFVWVANREAAANSPATAVLNGGRLSIISSNSSTIWSTDNSVPATQFRLLDNGNLVLLSTNGFIVWQSFDYPADTWLPEMVVTRNQSIVSWRSPVDPSPGFYSLRLRPPLYGEFELVFNKSRSYWSTGEWIGSRFAGVPEMTVPYFYNFSFGRPFTPEASFVYSGEAPPDSGLSPLLTRFAVDSWGRLVQYTWSTQAASWEIFWARPESSCKVYGRCGNLGLCVDSMLRPCSCPAGLSPANLLAWTSGDYSGGCVTESCGNADGFEVVGAVEFDGGVSLTFFNVSKGFCEDSCRNNCSCFGLTYDSDSQNCRNFHGNAYNFRNSSASPVLYIRVSAVSGEISGRSNSKLIAATAGSIVGFVASLAICVSILVIVRRKRSNARRSNKCGEEEDDRFQTSNLIVFSYKELSAATKGFSNKLGHGGFGAVFRGELSDGSQIAVKRLERPAAGSGDREFLAEVQTIGRVHHINLVRLRGFCYDGTHRLLVYDFMPSGPLSSFLRHRRQAPSSSPPLLSWQARFRIAVGTAKGIAYLHEECEERIIHCDIKPENILLDANLTPKIADFGLARLLGRELSRILITMRGTWGYVAPEWISGVAITPKADVYSYGMTLLELISGRRNVVAPEHGMPDGEDTGDGEWFFPPKAARKVVEGKVEDVLDMGLEGKYDREEAERVGKVAVWCIQDEESARPEMRMVVNMLEGTVEVAAPPQPQLLQKFVAGDESFARGKKQERIAAGSSGDGSEELNRAELG